MSKMDRMNPTLNPTLMPMLVYGGFGIILRRLGGGGALPVFSRHLNAVYQKKTNHRRDSNPQSPAYSHRSQYIVTYRRRRPMPYPLGHGGGL